MVGLAKDVAAAVQGQIHLREHARADDPDQGDDEHGGEQGHAALGLPAQACHLSAPGTMNSRRRSPHAGVVTRSSIASGGS